MERPNTLTVGSFEIDLSEFSGLGGMIGLASDVIDNRKFMGDDWADNNLAHDCICYWPEYNY